MKRLMLILPFFLFAGLGTSSCSKEKKEHSMRVSYEYAEKTQTGGVQIQREMKTIVSHPFTDEEFENKKDEFKKGIKEATKENKTLLDKWKENETNKSLDNILEEMAKNTKRSTKKFNKKLTKPTTKIIYIDEGE